MFFRVFYFLEMHVAIFTDEMMLGLLQNISIQ